MRGKALLVSSGISAAVGIVVMLAENMLQGMPEWIPILAFAFAGAFLCGWLGEKYLPGAARAELDELLNNTLVRDLTPSLLQRRDALKKQVAHYERIGEWGGVAVGFVGGWLMATWILAGLRGD